MNLYRYQQINDYTYEALKNSTLYFQNPRNFNDPFEFGQSWTKAGKIPNNRVARGIHKKEAGESFLDHTLIMGKDERLIGICCFSAINDNILLWAHYADKHSGLCLGYDFDLFPEDTFKHIAPENFELHKVSYSQDGKRKSVQEIVIEQYNDIIKIWPRPALLIKANDWAYEEEYRLVKRSVGSAQIFKSYLKEIIFGCRILPEHKETIKDICRIHYENKILFKTAIPQNESYRLNIQKDEN